jgi:AcrR family transcriptional regulator
MRDRRAERRQETIEEIVATAWRLCRAEGLAGLSLRELAAEVGMRPQSLYTYFDSKNAIYDAMYARGCREFAAGQAEWDLIGDARADVRTMARYFVEFCMQDPVRYQLLFQRPIPGFEPSPESFAISVDSLTAAQAHLASLGIDDPRDLDLFTAIGAGIASQQISNDPSGDRWSQLIDDAVDMFVDHVSKRAQLRSVEREGSRA